MDEANDLPDTGKRGYRRAMQALESGDFAAAASGFSKIASKKDIWGMLSKFYAAEAYLRLGLEQMRQQNYDAAIRSFTLSSRFNRTQDNLPRYLACCFAQLKQFDKACHFSDRETSLHPEMCDPRIRLALTLWRDGQQEAAIQALRDGLLVQPQQVEWHFQLGLLLAAREQYESASEALQTAIELDPDHIETLVHLGLVCGALQRPSDAIRHLTAAQHQQPNDARIGLYLAMASGTFSENQSLPQLHVILPVATPTMDIADVEELSQIVMEEPDVMQAFIDLPDIDTQQNVFELLAAVLDRALLQEPRRAELHYHQACIYKRLGYCEQAIASCERAIEINPQLVQALITLAKLYRQTDRQQDAAVRLQQVITLGFEYADVYYLLGCIYGEQGQREQARDSYQKALQINSGYRAAQEALEALAA